MNNNSYILMQGKPKRPSSHKAGNGCHWQIRNNFQHYIDIIVK